MSTLTPTYQSIWSQTRSCILENTDVSPTPFREYTYRAMVPHPVMMSNSLTASLVTSRQVNGWLGPGQFVIGYPVAGGQLYNLAVPVPRSSDAPLMSWNTPGDVEEMRKLFEGFCDTVRTLLGLVESCTKWTLGDLTPLETWESANGKVLLVGDAVHAATPHAAQGGAQAIEDAAALGECLARIERRDGLHRVVAAYEAIRKPRCELVQQIAKGSADLLALPDGPAQEERDRKYKWIMEMEETELREIGRAGIRAKPKPEPDMSASNIQTPRARMLLYGYDAAEGARKYLAEL